MNNIYFDNAATTQIDQSVIDLMNSIMSNQYGNPNSTHSFGRSSRTLIEKQENQLQKNLMFYLPKYFSRHVEQSLII